MDLREAEACFKDPRQKLKALAVMTEPFRSHRWELAFPKLPTVRLPVLVPTAHPGTSLKLSTKVLRRLSALGDLVAHQGHAPVEWVASMQYCECFCR